MLCIAQTSTECSEVGANTPLLRSRRQTPLWCLSACTGEVYCLLFVTAIGLVLGNGAFLLGRQFLGFYSADAEVISYGLLRMKIICTWYFWCGIMDVLVGSIRGLGYAVMPMIVSLLGACAFRVVWIYTFFAWDRTLQTLYISYPISWALTAAAHLICFIAVYRKMKVKN